MPAVWLAVWGMYIVPILLLEGQGCGPVMAVLALCKLLPWCTHPGWSIDCLLVEGCHLAKDVSWVVRGAIPVVVERWQASYEISVFRGV